MQLDERVQADDLRRQVEAIQWYHTIDLGRGVVTAGADNTPRKLSRLQLPERLDGKSVLDIGAWDGFFSFEAERRGASRVLATDSFVWTGQTWADKRGFDLAKRQLESLVEERQIDVMELSPEAVGTFDVVLFLGVLYHLKYPLLALEHVASVTRELAIIETVVDLLWLRRPAVAFYAGDELARDPTNWCAPNPAALLAMLRTVGFRRIEMVAAPRNPLFRAARSGLHRIRRGEQFWSNLRSDRVVVHAWK